MKKYVRAAALAGITLATVSVIALASKPACKDFISYWSAGQLLVQHADPYSRAQVFALELSQGLDASTPLIMRNPPWALWLVYPLGFLSPRMALLAWTAAALGAVAVCFQVFKVPARDRVLGFCFAPVYACLALGQSSFWMLLGFSLFVLLYRRRPFLAGAALLLVGIKPHLFLVLWPVLLLDCLHRRRFSLVAGAAAALGAASAIAAWLDPRVWGQYLAMLRASALNEEFVPTPAKALGLLISRNHAWVQLIPCAVAAVWAVHFYWQRRQRWDWAVDAMPVLLVTILVSPYAWMTDEIVLLPVVLAAIAAPNRARHTATIFMGMNAVALVMLAGSIQLSSGAYLWTSTAWAGWWWYSCRPDPQFAGQRNVSLADLRTETAAGQPQLY